MNHYKCFLLIAALILACRTGHESEAPSEQGHKVFQVRKMKVPNWVNSTSIYEVNIRQQTEEGTFRAFEKELPSIKEMGFRTICLLPVYPIGLDGRRGSMGSPYSIADFTKVNPELGSFEDLKALVTAIHRLHLHVIMDWVSHATALDHSWTSSHKEWYLESTHDLGNASEVPSQSDPDLMVLNYDVDAMRHTVIESMKFWLRAIDIDGFRCLKANLVPNDFWLAVRPSLETIKPVLMIAESTDVANHFETCFQADYGQSLFDWFGQLVSGEASVHHLANMLKEDRASHPLGYYHLNFTNSAYENAHRGSDSERYGAAAKAMAVIAFSYEGIPMMSGGQERGLQSALSFYDREPIPQEKNQEFEGFYKRLTHLKLHNKALWNGNAGGPMERLSEDPKVYAYLRTKDDNTVVTIVNCSSEKVKTSIDRDLRSLTDLFPGKDYLLKEGTEVSLEPWQYLVLSNPSILL